MHNFAVTKQQRRYRAEMRIRGGRSHFFRLRSATVPKFVNTGPDPCPAIFKFANPTPVQTPAAVIDPTVIYPYFYLRNDHTDYCYCRNWKVTLDPGPVFPNIFTRDPGLKEKHRILPESTPTLWIPLPPLMRIWLDLDCTGSGLWRIMLILDF